MPRKVGGWIRKGRTGGVVGVGRGAEREVGRARAADGPAERGLAGGRGKGVKKDLECRFQTPTRCRTVLLNCLL